MNNKRKAVFFVALITIARWSILINDQDVVNESNFTDTITPVFAGTTNIKSDVIAPTAEGYFELVLNGENTDVSFQYTISIDTTDCEIDDLKISRYTINGTQYTYTPGSDIVGNILLTDASQVATVRFYVTWDDAAATQTMDNAADTAASLEETTSFTVDVNLLQLQ